MKKIYNSEIEGMIDFYQELGLESIVDYECNTDGRVNGCLNEFKLVFTDLTSHKNQVLRYLSSYNAVAKAIPAKVILIDLNGRKYIEGDVFTKKITTTDNITKKTKSKIVIEIAWKDDLVEWVTPAELMKYYNLNSYCKGWIDENSIISYNNIFCSLNNKKTTSKDEVKKEFITPNTLNIHSFDWYGQVEKEKNGREDNNWLTFNMNMLGSEILKRQLGAFFTPDKYVKISTEYLRKAIKNVPEGKDYVIIDRCAGTGNLEKFLTNDELSHCILNTIDYTEWTTLKGLYEGRVRYIMPHSAKSRNENNGLMSDGDALQKEFYDKLIPMTKDKYVIMLENPPYADVGGMSGGHNKDKVKTYIYTQMIDDIGGNLCNELGHQFIWSAWKYIKPDEYILYSPIKYWKLYNLSNRKLINGTLCKSELFNTPNKFSISLMHWNKEISQSEEIIVNIEDSKETIKIKKCKERFEYDKTKYNSEVIAKYRAESFMMGNANVYLSNFNNGTTIWKRSKPIHKENILEVIPLFVAKLKYLHYNDWTEKMILFNSFDGEGKYKEDDEFKHSCLLFTCLSDSNRCISSESLKNQLCLSQGTIADSLLSDRQKQSNLIKLWNELLKEVKEYPEYNKNYKYGLYQIQKDINIKIDTGNFNKKGEPTKAIKYPTLDEKIKKLKLELKDFYKQEIEKKLFKYELLK